MASHCYLFGPAGELFVEYLVRNCSISDEEISVFENSRESAKSSGGFQRLQYKKLEVYFPNNKLFCFQSAFQKLLFSLVRFG